MFKAVLTPLKPSAFRLPLLDYAEFLSKMKKCFSVKYLSDLSTYYPKLCTMDLCKKGVAIADFRLICKQRRHLEAHNPL